MLEDTEVTAEVKANLIPEDFKNFAVREIVKAIFILTSKGESVTPSQLMSYIGDEEINRVISALVATSMEFFENKQKWATFG